VKHGGKFLFRSKVAATAAAVVLTVALGYLDYFTGREWAISAFYLVPISLAAWVAGRMAGIDCGDVVYLFGVLE